ncbi:MAG: putative glycolipid-binding domain-containing protein [Anaerolineales bacterium]
MPVSGRGHDSCSLSSGPAGWRLDGNLWLERGQGVLRLAYRVLCDSRWTTRAVHLDLEWAGARRALQLTADNLGHWWVAGEVRSELSGCHDVDLNLSPATNTLPIRRLNLAAGDSQDIHVVWLRLPDLTMTRSAQSYRRVADDAYLFRNLDNGFEALLKVDGDGLVTDYPGGWALAPPPARDPRSAVS